MLGCLKSTVGKFSTHGVVEPQRASPTMGHVPINQNVHGFIPKWFPTKYFTLRICHPFWDVHPYSGDKAGHFLSGNTVCFGTEAWKSYHHWYRTQRSDKIQHTVPVHDFYCARILIESQCMREGPVPAYRLQYITDMTVSDLAPIITTVGGVKCPDFHSWGDQWRQQIPIVAFSAYLVSVVHIRCWSGHQNSPVLGLSRDIAWHRRAGHTDQWERGQKTGKDSHDWWENMNCSVKTRTWSLTKPPPCR